MQLAVIARLVPIVGVRVAMAQSAARAGWNAYISSRLAPFVPTPLTAIARALVMAGVGPGDVFFDLGSGDGRVAIEAARTGALSVGVEIEAGLVDQARNAARAARVGDNALFVAGSLFEVDKVVARDTRLPRARTWRERHEAEQQRLRAEAALAEHGATSSVGAGSGDATGALQGALGGLAGATGRPRSRSQRAQESGARTAAVGSDSWASDAGRSGPGTTKLPDGFAAFRQTGLGLADATICYLFMGDWEAQKLIPLLETSLSPGTRVVSCGYPLHTVAAQEAAGAEAAGGEVALEAATAAGATAGVQEQRDEAGSGTMGDLDQNSELRPASWPLPVQPSLKQRHMLRSAGTTTLPHRPPGFPWELTMWDMVMDLDLFVYQVPTPPIESAE